MALVAWGGGAGYVGVCHFTSLIGRAPTGADIRQRLPPRKIVRHKSQFLQREDACKANLRICFIPVLA